jgi:crotonobetainyl-CoA:carnitine CoA-transferase CaiB-like acyl-CoA transferase
MLSVVGCLAALFHAKRTGQGQELWTSLLDGGAVFASDAMVKADGTPVPRPRLDKFTTGIDPGYRLYETQDGWVQVAAVKPEQWDALCTTLGVDPSLDRSTAGAQVEMRFRTRTAVSWSYRLDDAGVPNEIAVDPKGGDLALFDADAERLGLVTDYGHPILGAMRQFGNTIDFSDTPPRPFGPPPLIGEHTQEILAWLGHDDARLTELRDQGVITWPDADYAAAW